MFEENSLTRLKAAYAENSDEAQFSMDEIVNSNEEMIDGMSKDAEEAMLSKFQEQQEKIEVPKEEIKEEAKPKIEKVVRTQQPKKGKNKKEKNKQEEFFNDIANECIDIMIQSGITVHDFSNDQMNIIWDYIKNKINN